MSKKYKLSACQLNGRDGDLMATLNPYKGELKPSIVRTIALFEKLPVLNVSVWNKYADCMNRKQTNVTYHPQAKSNGLMYRNYNFDHFADNGELRKPLKLELERVIKLCIYSMGKSPYNYHLVDCTESIESINALKAWKADNESASMPIRANGITLSVYGGRINELVRYWHDLIHLELNAGFGCADELKVTAEHIRQLKLIDSPYIGLFCDIVNADIGGQTEYYNLHKRFIIDGKRFVHNYLYDSSNTVLNFSEVEK